MAAPASDERVPTVPDHEVIRLIGRGSGGQVWLAKNALGTFRAVKLVRQQPFKHRQAFEREFQGILKFEPISRLHDGLVDILQVGINEQQRYFYYVMELADDVGTGQSITPE
jgi:serine/threonine protein kinase